jgi:hypothetical protein
VESWAAYVKRFAQGEPFQPLLTWSSPSSRNSTGGLRAVLDYHATVADPGRMQWVAVQPFETSLEWRAWTAFANGEPQLQKDVVETLSNLAPDVNKPPLGDLMKILRTLRVTTASLSSSALDAEGGYDIKFEKSAQVRGSVDAEVTIPPEIWIVIPVLKGDTKPTRVNIMVRPDVVDGRLYFRLSMPLAERALDQACGFRRDAAEAALGEGFKLLRASS